MQVKTLILALLACAFASAATAQPRFDGDFIEHAPTVTISASAEVSAAPDQATVRLGAVAESADAADAQNRINTVMHQVLAAITALGVPAHSVRTESLSLSPVYSRPDNHTNGQGEAQAPHITGYRAANVISVNVDDLAKVGAVIDAGIHAGANQLQGISFDLKDAEGPRAAALKLAVQKARTEANAVAAALGVQIVGVKSVAVNGSGVTVPRRYAMVQMASAVATPVQPGELEVPAHVTVTYLLRGPHNHQK